MAKRRVTPCPSVAPVSPTSLAFERPLNEKEPFIVKDRAARVAMGFDHEPLLVLRAVNEQRPALANPQTRERPQLLPHSRREGAHEHARANLEHPARELTSKPGGRSLDDDDG